MQYERMLKMKDKTSSNVSIDFTSQEFLANPYPFLKKIRENQGVHYDPHLQRWFITNYDDAKKLLRDPDLCHDLHKADRDTASFHFIDVLEDEILAPLFQDPPYHTVLRSAMAKQFTPRKVDLRAKEIMDLSNTILDGFNKSDSIEIVTEYASLLTIRVITDIIGVAPSDWQRYFALTQLNNLAFDARLMPDQKKEMRNAQQELRELFFETISQRKQSPLDDLISDMLTSGEDFSDHQIAIVCQFLLRAGNLTSTDLISNAIFALLSHPDELRALVTNPALIDDAINEVLRYDSPALEAGRITTKPIVVKGRTIPGRQTLMISLAAANHDATQFENPEKFLISRKNKEHLSFGGSSHFCLGAHLAKLEARIAIGNLLKRFPHLKLDQSHPSKRHGLTSFQGFSSLYVKLM